MIKEKKQNQNTEAQLEGNVNKPEKDAKTPVKKEIVEVSLNPMTEIFQAVKRTLSKLKTNPNDPESLPLFRTISIDNGQYQRIIRDINMETEIAFPAVFVHFTNVHFLVKQNRIYEGQATLRIRFILNNLNNSHVDMECEPFEVFNRINVAIQDAKDTEKAFSERCTLQYFDMPTTSNMLQAFWVDYEVWFTDVSAYEYRNWLERYIVIPPFTNHSDAKPENRPEDHTDHKTPTYDEVSKVTIKDYGI